MKNNKNMEKRGQITLFIIVGVVLLLIFGILFYAAGRIRPPVEVDSVKVSTESFVTKCLDKVSEDSLVMLGRDGFPYSLVDAEDWLGGYVDDNLNKCIKDFRDLEGLGLKFEESDDLKTEVIIAKKDVQFRLKYPIKEVRGSKTTSYENFFNAEIIILSDILGVVEGLALMPIDDINASIFNGSMLDVDVYVENEQVFVVIKDLQYLVEGFPYEYLLIR